MKIQDKNPNEVIEKTAKQLESVITMPEWALFVKTSHGKDRVPSRDDWYFVRSAAILRKIYIDGPLGVSKLRTKFGSKKNRGSKPEKFVRASGKIIRSIVQQLEKAELIKQVEKGVHKGRVITDKGKSFIDKAAK